MNLEAKNEIIQKILDFKMSNNLEELQIARLLRKELSCFAIKWTTTPTKEFVIYDKDKDDKNKDIMSHFQTFFEILDFLYFIQKLEKDGFVNILPIYSDNESETPNILFDREKYKYNVDHPIKLPDGLNLGEDYFYTEHGGVKYLTPIKNKQKINIDIIDLFDNYATKIIYPLPKLEEYLKNKFQTIEEVRYNEQLKRTDKSIRIATISGVIAAISVFVTTCTLFKESSNQLKLDAIQFERVEKLIKKENTKQLINNEAPANKAENQDLNVIKQTAE
ncbi:MAG: hypothetical protein ACRCX4_06285 [Bacteroidales bacterium]